MDEPEHRELPEPMDAPPRRSFEEPASSMVCTEAPLGVLDRLSLASRAAARVACEQCAAVDAAARAIEASARRGGTIWVVGAGAEAHAGRLAVAGHRTNLCLDLERLPTRFGPSDVALITVSDEAPRALLEELQRREARAIVLGGPHGVDLDGTPTIRVPCYDERALELAHGFIIMALCAEMEGVDRAESAA